MTSRRFCVLVLAAAATGCALTDPYQRQGMWQPEGTSPGNLAAMLEDPRDLVRGRPLAPLDRHGSGDAVARLWADQPKPFLSAAQPGGQAPGQGAPGAGNSANSGGGAGAGGSQGGSPFDPGHGAASPAGGS
jgi:hypothetical protein